jgi:deoxyribose-phosphate aldolase
MQSSICSYIDLTLLQPDATQTRIRELCEDALRFHFAVVCVNPTWVKLCASLLAGTEIGVCTVVGFPLGATTCDAKVFEAQRGIEDGAGEIDMVLNVGFLKSGFGDRVLVEIQRVAGAVHALRGLLKVIIETPLLDDGEKVSCCLLAREAGADFVKTATGFSAGGATVEDVALMRRTVGDRMGVKASGGIRDLVSARQMIAAGATRIGTSSGVRIAREEADAL